MNIKILQIPMQTKINNPDLYLKNILYDNKDIDISNYEMVYEYDEDFNIEDDFDILEKIFHKFNVEQPEDYKNPSLTSGDVIELDNRKYFCAFMGWKKL